MKKLLLRLTFAGMGVFSTPSYAQPPTPSCTAKDLRSVESTRRMIPYPDAAKRLGETGVSVVKIIVGPNGTPTSITLETSSGSQSLDDATLVGIRDWRWLPLSAGCTSIETMAKWEWTLSFAEPVPEPGRIIRFKAKDEDYPPNWEQGGVMLTTVQIIVGKNGELLKYSVTKTSGSKPLDFAAEKFVKRLKLEPLRIDGQPTISGAVIEIEWSKKLRQ